MNQDQKRSRFERRVALERSFLRVINQRFQDPCVPLSGMTSKAISAWSTANVTLIEAEDRQFAVAVLEEASRRAELLADNSKQTFEPDHGIDQSTIDALLSRLASHFS